MADIRAVDVFCGIGGLTRGLLAAGIEVVAGLDIDPSCRYAYEANNLGAVFLEADIYSTSFSEFESYYGKSAVKALVGCAPCQPYSAHTRRAGSKEDYALVGEFKRLIQEGLPELVFMENVPGLAKHESFQDFIATLEHLGYHMDYDTLNFYHYSVPQRRCRLVLIASRCGPIRLPAPNDNTKKVSDYIRNLDAISAGETSAKDPAHTTLPLTPTNLARIRQSKPGGTWKDWDEDLVNACHTRAHFPASYGRMEWCKPAPTITTQFCYYSTGRFGHPTQDRALSVREAALLQTFPIDYRLVDPDKSPPIHQMARHVGNAVPVKIGELIGKSLMKAAGHG